MKSRKRSRILIILGLVCLLGVIVYAVTETPGGGITRGGKIATKTRDNDIGAIKVGLGLEKPKSANMAFKEESEKLIKYFDSANQEREKDKKVSGKTEQQATATAAKMRDMLESTAKEAEGNGFNDSAEYFRQVGKIVTDVTDIMMRPELTKIDLLEELTDYSEKEREYKKKAYSEIKASSLSKEQKKYMKEVSLNNLKEQSKEIGGLLKDMTGLFTDKKSLLKKFGKKKEPEDKKDKGLGDAIIAYLKSLKNSIMDSIDYLKKLLGVLF